MNRHLVIEIDRKGEVVVRAEGYSGPSCLTDIQKALDLIGAQVKDSRPLPEFFQTETQSTWLTQK